jgi:membrane-associated phospholipid phosphatase
MVSPQMRRLLQLRSEEVVALLFFGPTTYLTLLAHRYAQEHGLIGPKYPGGLVRLAVAALLLAALALALRLWPGVAVVRAARDVLPFLACILIYTNLHDTIGFVNPHDVHAWLAAADRVLFGVSPCVWAERFVTPARTEVMAFLYAGFFWIAPSVPLLLLVLRRPTAFREALRGIVTCFYLGYALYVVLPAAPPRLYLAHEFHVNLKGYPNLVFALSEQTLNFLPADSRAAFPSLHAAVSLLALVYAWRHLRPFFWVLLPCSLGLWVSTVYLRHHYVVDLFAGWLLAPVAFALAPWLDVLWGRLGGNVPLSPRGPA